MYSRLATLFSLASVVYSSPIFLAVDPPSGQSGIFSLHVTSNANLTAWAVKTAASTLHPGYDVITIQRPSAYTSDPTYLNGTAAQEASLVFSPATSSDVPFEVILPDVPAGTVGEITAQQSSGTPTFYLDENSLLSVHGSAGSEGLWACPTTLNGEETFVLFFGVDPETDNLPSAECQSIKLQATFAS